VKKEMQEFEAFLYELLEEVPVVYTTSKYFKVCSNNATSVYCFIAKQDIANKTIGSISAGDILKPANWKTPARGVRGSVFDKKTWGACGKYGFERAKPKERI